MAFLDPTTESLFRIHADTPFSYSSLLYYSRSSGDRKKSNLLFLSALCLCLFFWAKLPTLPACILPAIFFATNGKWKFFVLFLLTFNGRSYHNSCIRCHFMELMIQSLFFSIIFPRINGAIGIPYLRKRCRFTSNELFRSNPSTFQILRYVHRAILDHNNRSNWSFFPFFF